MGASITLDQASKDHLDKQFQLLKEAGKKSVYAAIVKTAYQIANEAKLRLKGQGHVVTARLMNSIFVKTKDNATEAYTDNQQTSFTAELTSVTIGENETAIGTNVDYGEKIENKYPFLSWAARNIDVMKSIGDQAKLNIENVMKFGKGIIPAMIRDAKPKYQRYSTFAKKLQSNPRQKGETVRKYANRLK